MSAPIRGGLPLSRTSYALVVGAAGLLWSALYVVSLWEGIRATVSRAAQPASTRVAPRSPALDRADARLAARRSLEERTGAWEDDGGRIADETFAGRPREVRARHATFR